MMIVFPPIKTHLLRLVDGADDQADANGEQLDLGERDLDVSSNHEPFVQHAIENVDEPGVDRPCPSVSDGIGRYSNG